MREQRMNLGDDGGKALAWSMNIEPAIDTLRLASFAVGLPRCKAEDRATRDEAPASVPAAVGETPAPGRRGPGHGDT
jgi:hypothetical protein